MVKLEFQMNRTDILHSMYLSVTAPALLIRIGVILLCGIAAGIMVSRNASALSTVTWFGVFFLVVVLGLVIRCAIFYCITKNALARSGRNIYTFDEKGYTAASTLSQSQGVWAAIRKARETTYAYALYISQDRYIFLPKRTFASPEAENEFRTLLIHYVSACKLKEHAEPAVAPMDN